MSSSHGNVGAITLFVADLAASKAFYGDGLGWELAWEDSQSVGFNAGNTIINLLLESEAADLITPAPVAPRDGGQRVMFSIFVENVDSALALLADRGIASFNGPIDRPWGMRTACVVDPDGYVWELAQEIG